MAVGRDARRSCRAARRRSRPCRPARIGALPGRRRTRCASRCSNDRPGADGAARGGRGGPGLAPGGRASRSRPCWRPGLARAAARIAPARRAGRLCCWCGWPCSSWRVGAVAASGAARGWAGDRVSEFRGEGGDAVANDPGRLVNAAGNQRKGWWGEAWRGFRDAPVLGQGAGGFALVHLQERRTATTRSTPASPTTWSLRCCPAPASVGLVLLLALVVAVAWGGRSARSARHPGPDDRPAPGDPRGVRPPGGGRLVVGDPRPHGARLRRRGGRPGRGASAGPPARAPAAPGRGRRPWRRRAVVAVSSAALPWWSARAAAGRARRARRRPPGDALELARRRRAPPTRFGRAPCSCWRGRAHRPGPSRPARWAPTSAPPGYSRTTRLWRALAIFLGGTRARRPRGGRCTASTPGPRGRAAGRLPPPARARWNPARQPGPGRRDRSGLRRERDPEGEGTVERLAAAGRLALSGQVDQPQARARASGSTGGTTSRLVSLHPGRAAPWMAAT